MPPFLPVRGYAGEGRAVVGVLWPEVLWEAALWEVALWEVGAAPLVEDLEGPEDRLRLRPWAGRERL